MSFNRQRAENRITSSFSVLSFFFWKGHSPSVDSASDITANCEDSKNVQAFRQIITDVNCADTSLIDDRNLIDIDIFYSKSRVTVPPNGKLLLKD